MNTIGFIGAGTVGTAIATCLSRSDYAVVGVYSRNPASAQKLAGRVPECKVYLTSQEAANAADFIFITTPDAAIPVAAAQVNWRRGQNVVHCSGADSLDVLEPARKAGAFVGSFHPLQTFASVDQAIQNLPGSTFGLEAEEPLMTGLKEMARALGGNPIVLKAGDKVLYHAAAVLTSNYVVTLVKLATDLWQTFGVGQDQATKALLPLLAGTLKNIGSVGLPNCLTGPIARGDVGTVTRHIKALELKTPHLVSAYSHLGLQTLPVAIAKGRIEPDKAKELEELLKQSIDPSIVGATPQKTRGNVRPS